MRSMHWKVKATLQRACASMPGGTPVYDLLQRTVGGLRKVDVMRKLAFQRNLCALMIEHGFRPRGARVVEVGTGWLPLDAVGFWMCGAAGVVTLDLNRHLDARLLQRALETMTQRRDELLTMWRSVAPEAEVAERLAVLARAADRPTTFLREAGIDYRAPGDASRTGLEDGSVDAHFSYNVFEHVPGDAIEKILAEARRILKPGGVCVHYVDPSDHFAHFDRTITRINFLRFDDTGWDRLAGNRFAYHNRLRDADYRALFARAGLELKFCRFDVEPRSLSALRDGFPLAEPWRGRSPEELARHNLVYVATRRASTEGSDRAA
jgi:SAM-dependent methyltransferase